MSIYRETLNIYPWPWMIEEVSRYVASLRIERGIKGRKILELGPRKGELTARLAENNSVTTVDTESNDIIKKCSRFVKHDLNKPMPFKDSAFDVVFAMEILEHLQKPETAVREMSRVLKKDGKAYIDVPTETFNISTKLLYYIDLPIDSIRQSLVKGDRKSIMVDLKKEYFKGMSYPKRFALVLWQRLNDGPVIKASHIQQHGCGWWAKLLKNNGFKIMKKYNSGPLFPLASFLPYMLHEKIATSRLSVLPAFLHFECKNEKSLR